jgi:hypothetical protein
MKEEQINESGGDVVYKKGEHHIEKYGEDVFALYKNDKKQKNYTSIQAAKSAISEDTEQLEEGKMKDIATNREEDKRLGSWRKETPWMKVKSTVTDKSGAKHTPMSRARDLARAAANKNVKESVSITESRLADIVREAADSAKKKKKEAEKDKVVSDDKFQKDPELSTQIIRND